MSIKHFDDGLARCSWLNSDQLYIDYHDTEWGVPRHGDQEMFERIALEGFQAGLSWITILKRREGFRAAFHGFDLERVAAMNEHDVDRLMADSGIIRNRAKILSTIKNANTILDMGANGESISELVWSFAPPAEARMRPEATFEWVATTAESDSLSKELRRRGFSFVGSTTMYALMQATGFVNDHAPGCFRREQLG